MTQDALSFLLPNEISCVKRDLVFHEISLISFATKFCLHFNCQITLIRKHCLNFKIFKTTARSHDYEISPNLHQDLTRLHKFPESFFFPLSVCRSSKNCNNKKLHVLLYSHAGCSCCKRFNKLSPTVPSLGLFPCCWQLPLPVPKYLLNTAQRKNPKNMWL